MIRFLARWWARRSYIWDLELEAGKSDVNAAIAQRNANEVRKLAEQLTAEADAIDKNIEEQAKALEAGVWECENGHQKGGAFGPDEDGAARKCIECNAPTKYLKISEMTGQEKYDLEKQKVEAEKIAAEKRKLAEEQSKSVTEKEQTAQSLRGLAENSRRFANKIRQL